MKKWLSIFLFILLLIALSIFTPPILESVAPTATLTASSILIVDPTSTNTPIPTPTNTNTSSPTDMVVLSVTLAPLSTDTLTPTMTNTQLPTWTPSPTKKPSEGGNNGDGGDTNPCEPWPICDDNTPPPGTPGGQVSSSHYSRRAKVEVLQDRKAYVGIT